MKALTPSLYTLANFTICIVLEDLKNLSNTYIKVRIYNSSVNSIYFCNMYDQSYQKIYHTKLVYKSHTLLFHTLILKN